jgi:aldehyde dehydrogenase (NAD+)
MSPMSPVDPVPAVPAVARLRSSTLHPDLFVGGRWVARATRLTVDDPSTGAVIGSVAAAGPQDVEDAVAAARAAFERWAYTEPAERAALLTALADAMSAREQEFASLITLEMGAPADFSLEVQTRLAIDVIRSYAALLESFEWSEPIPGGNSTNQGVVVREAAGVVAAITPWNYPLYQIAAKLGAALAAGCAVVLKPSGVAPLNALLLAECAETAGLPPGLLSVLSGSGRSVGEALARHPGVDVLSFTGSTEVGTQVMRLAAGSVKRVGLELGGKSAAVVLPGADLARAVAETVDDVFANTGQTCTALTRLLVPADRYQEAVAAAVAAGARHTLGDPSQPGPHLGPSASASQRDTVLDHLRTAEQEGARTVLGGAGTPELPAHLDHLRAGYWVQPTILADVTAQMRIAREEVFGPVLCLMSYQDLSQALELSNDSDYGLSGAVWAADREQAVAFARRMRTGRVQINGGGFNLHAPTGGYKLSGVGRELGRWGLEEFTEVKSLMLGAD